MKSLKLLIFLLLRLGCLCIPQSAQQAMNDLFMIFKVSLSLNDADASLITRTDHRPTTDAISRVLNLPTTVKIHNFTIPGVGVRPRNIQSSDLSSYFVSPKHTPVDFHVQQPLQQNQQPNQVYKALSAAITQSFQDGSFLLGLNQAVQDRSSAATLRTNRMMSIVDYEFSSAHIVRPKATQVDVTRRISDILKEQVILKADALENDFADDFNEEEGTPDLNESRRLQTDDAVPAPPPVPAPVAAPAPAPAPVPVPKPVIAPVTAPVSAPLTAPAPAPVQAPAEQPVAVLPPDTNQPPFGSVGSLSPTTPGQEQPPEGSNTSSDGNKPFFSTQAGLITIIVVVFVVLAAIIGALVYYFFFYGRPKPFRNVNPPGKWANIATPQVSHDLYHPPPRSAAATGAPTAAGAAVAPVSGGSGNSAHFIEVEEAVLPLNTINL
jgi:hypothetical protein